MTAGGITGMSTLHSAAHMAMGQNAGGTQFLGTCFLFTNHSFWVPQVPLFDSAQARDRRVADISQVLTQKHVNKHPTHRDPVVQDQAILSKAGVCRTNGKGKPSLFMMSE